MNTKLKGNKTFLKDFLLLTGIIGLFFSFMLGSRPLSAPDEGRYTEIPREMSLSHDYVTPRLNGVKYFEKPPLIYWLTSFSLEAFGVNEWSARLWPAVLGLLGCLMVYTIGTRFFSRGAGIASALILASNVLFYAHSRLLILDMGVTFFMSLSLFAYLWATQAINRKEQIIALALFFSGAACSTLTKGLIGITIPGAIILLWTLITRNFSALKLAFKPWGILLFLIIATPWHLLASMRNPEFPEFYFIREHFLRYLTPIHCRTQPVWFFIPILLIGWFPWTALLIHTLKEIGRNLRDNPIHLFLMLWAGFVLVFFSLSNSKLIPYILPVFPPLAVLLGNKIVQAWQTNQLPRWVGFLNAGIAGLIAVAIPIVLRKQDMEHMLDLRPYIITVIILTAISCIVMATLAYHRRVRLTIISTFLLGLIILPVLNAAWPHLDRRSVKSLAIFIQKSKQHDDTVIAYGRYYQDLPPYVGQKILVIGWQGELEFGMSIEDTSRWMMDKEQFLKVYNTLGNVYIVTRKEFVHELVNVVPTLRVVAETEKDLLLTNKP
jgi:4-amino-4-deoxy-L-arabinose transferase-like glycosyltransferase